ncbi:uncharacterized protein LOC136028411 isoform X1 [Artemia franciscana]|uniref:uncharacterized protein LOC136028411 isoform X1 n=1 Tax=Artemia franciscana TaxID=6661 RepID=UPI0032DA3DB8
MFGITLFLLLFIRAANVNGSKTIQQTDISSGDPEFSGGRSLSEVLPYNMKINIELNQSPRSSANATLMLPMSYSRKVRKRRDGWGFNIRNLKRRFLDERVFKMKLKNFVSNRYRTTMDYIPLTKLLSTSRMRSMMGFKNKFDPQSRSEPNPHSLITAVDGSSTERKTLDMYQAAHNLDYQRVSSDRDNLSRRRLYVTPPLLRTTDFPKEKLEQKNLKLHRSANIASQRFSTANLSHSNVASRILKVASPVSRKETTMSRIPDVSVGGLMKTDNRQPFSYHYNNHQRQTIDQAPSFYRSNTATPKFNYGSSVLSSYNIQRNSENSKHQLPAREKLAETLEIQETGSISADQVYQTSPIYLQRGDHKKHYQAKEHKVNKPSVSPYVNVKFTQQNLTKSKHVLPIVHSYEGRLIPRVEPDKISIKNLEFDVSLSKNTSITRKTPPTLSLANHKKYPKETLGGHGHQTLKSNDNLKSDAIFKSVGPTNYVNQEDSFRRTIPSNYSDQVNEFISVRQSYLQEIQKSIQKAISAIGDLFGLPDLLMDELGEKGDVDAIGFYYDAVWDVFIYVIVINTVWPIIFGNKAVKGKYDNLPNWVYKSFEFWEQTLLPKLGIDVVRRGRKLTNRHDELLQQTLKLFVESIVSKEKLEHLFKKYQ